MTAFPCRGKLSRIKFVRVKTKQGILMRLVPSISITLMFIAVKINKMADKTKRELAWNELRRARDRNIFNVLAE